MHVESSGLKAAATWHRIEILQNCRECCGGMGFLAANKIGPMLADMNVDATFEGDNTVMMQQVSPIAALSLHPFAYLLCMRTSGAFSCPLPLELHSASPFYTVQESDTLLAARQCQANRGVAMLWCRSQRLCWTRPLSKARRSLLLYRPCRWRATVCFSPSANFCASGASCR